MKFALAQMNSTAKWQENFDVMMRWTRKAARGPSQAILFPENALFMGHPDKTFAVAEELQAQNILRELCRLAQEQRIAILVGGYPVPHRAKRKLYNTAFWIDEKGKILARYAKIHLFDVVTPEGARYSESRQIVPGRRHVVFSWKGLRLGMSICYDLRFPEQYRRLSARGAGWLLIPSAFTQETGRAHWHALIRARAIENLAVVLAPAQTGTHPQKGTTFGHSLAVDPWGKVLCDGGTKPGLNFVEIPKNAEVDLRKRFPVLVRQI